MFSRIRAAFKESFGEAAFSEKEAALQGIIDGHIDKIRRFLARGGDANAAVLLRGAGPSGSSIKPRPLVVWAATYHNSAATALLLDAGASPDSYDPNDGLSLLHSAAAAGDLALAERLLKDGASPDGHNGHGAGSPLFVAATRGNEAMVSMLLKAGADPNLKNWAGIAPLEAIGAMPNGEVCGTVLRRRG